MAIVNNYLNYIGSKDRYLPQILKFIEAGASLTGGAQLIDLFCGSAVVGLNSAKLFKKVRCVDACKELITIHQWVQGYDTPEAVLADIDLVTTKYQLSKENKEGFLKLREDYNKESIEQGVIRPAFLFNLITHSYNYSLHTNKKGGFNVPFGQGRSYFNKNLRQKLINWKNELNNSLQVSFECTDFRNVEVSSSSVVFVDPPYSASISKHPYRVGNIKWTADEDRALLSYLDNINKQGSLFVFTNVIANNGIVNKPLLDWVALNDYIVTPVHIDYKNCSYQRKNNGKTEEVIITNFKLQEKEND